MERRISQIWARPQATRLGRLVKVFLAAIYLIVGFTGEIACAKESFFASVQISVGDLSNKTDEGSKKAPTVVDHCYSCVPITLPSALMVYEPVGLSTQRPFVREAVLVLEGRLPDPPRPKF